MEKYFYSRDEFNRPVVTICEMQINNIFCRGIAVCSKKDNPSKKIGKAIARGRCLKAFRTKESRDEVHRRRAAAVIMTATPILTLYDDYKSAYDVHPITVV